MNANQPQPDIGRMGDAQASPLPLGFVLADFQIERVLGEGGFGIVYLARDVHLKRAVAIKEFMPTSMANRAADYSVVVRSQRDQETFSLGLQSFIKEAVTLAQFDHPALVKVFRFWEERGTAYMVMPYYEGQTLKSWLRSQTQTPSEGWLRQLLKPLLAGLAHLHEQGCLHRDIAPDNILLLQGERPLLIDFGAARQVMADKTQALTVILKPGYAPIEQYGEATLKQGPWTDIYALSAVLYCAVTGRPPLSSVSRVLNDDLVPATVAGRGRYSEAFLRVIDAGLAVKPQERPQNVAALLALLDATETVGLPDTAALPDPDDERTVAFTSPLKAEPRQTIVKPESSLPLAQVQAVGKRKFLWGALVVACVGLGGATVAYLRRPEPTPPMPLAPTPTPATQVAKPVVPTVAAPAPLPPAPTPPAPVPAPTPSPTPARAEPQTAPLAKAPPPVVSKPSPTVAATSQRTKPDKVAQGHQQECARLLQAWSMGQDVEANEQKMAALRCK